MKQTVKQKQDQELVNQSKIVHTEILLLEEVNVASSALLIAVDVYQNAIDELRRTKKKLLDFYAKERTQEVQKQNTKIKQVNKPKTKK